MRSDRHYPILYFADYFIILSGLLMLPFVLLAFALGGLFLYMAFYIAFFL